MTAASVVTIPARRGKVAFMARGQSVRVINTHGQQVVDTWAFSRDDLTEFMSVEHSRTSLRRIMPMLGQAMVTNQRRPILTLVDDVSGGIHDTLLAACDRYRYEPMGCADYHDNCADKLNQYQGGMCVSGVLKTTERTPRRLISPLGPKRVATDSAV